MRRLREHPAAPVVLGVVVSVVLLGGCVTWALGQDPPEFPHDLGHWMLLLLAILVTACNTAARGWRWDRILDGIDVAHRRSDAYGLTVVAYMGNVILPARGGELLRVGLLVRRSNARLSQALGTIFPERILDAATLVLFLCLLAALGTVRPPGGTATIVAAAVAVAAGFAGLFAYARLRRAGRLAAVGARIGGFTQPSRFLLTRRGAGLALLTFGVWCGEGLVLDLVAEAVSVDLTLPEATAAAVAASFAAILPAAPGYLGTFDAALLIVLSQFGVKGGAAVGLVLLYRFVIFVPITVAGLVLMLTRYGGLGALRIRREPSPAPVPAER